MRICSRISQIRFCRAPPKTFTPAGRTILSVLSSGDAALSRALQGVLFLRNQISHFTTESRNHGLKTSSDQALSVPERKARPRSFAGSFVLDRSGLILSLVHADLSGWERASRQRAPQELLEDAIVNWRLGFLLGNFP